MQFKIGKKWQRLMNMEARFLFVLAVFTQWKVIRTVSNLGDFEGITFRHKMFFSGEINEDVNFLHKTFPVPPSTRATIEVKVLVPNKLLRKPRRFPVMGIYTTTDHINIKKQCTHVRYGQLLNRDLHPGLTLHRYRSRSLTCNLHYTKVKNR